MKELEDFYQRALKYGICDEYKDRFKNVVGKSNIMNLLCEKKASDYFIDCVTKGIAPSVDFVKETFSQYINGNKVFYKDDIISVEWYFGYDGDIVSNSTYLYLCGCNGNLICSNGFQIVNIFGECNLNVYGGGRKTCVYEFGANNVLYDNNNLRIRYK